MEKGHDKDVVSSGLLNALSLLSKEIGIYGERIDMPVLLCFENGLCLRDHTGLLIAVGTNNVAKAIAEKSI